jgi:hypothetical protein
MDDGVRVESEPVENATFSPETQVAIAREREHIVAQRSDLVGRASSRWQTATVSARVQNEALFVITPAQPDESPETVILADLDGVAVPHTPGWDAEPSPSVAEHALLYRERSAVGGVADLADADARIFGVGPSAAAAVDAVLDAAASSPTTPVPGSNPGELHH